MYILLPPYFCAKWTNNEKSKNLIIYSKTYLCKGVRYDHNNGEWSETAEDDCLNNKFKKYSARYHWIYVLYTYRTSTPTTDYLYKPNAIVFRENGLFILEIIQDVYDGEKICATFYDIIEDDLQILFFNDAANTNLKNDEPLDLSFKTWTISKNSKLSDNLEGNQKQKQKRRSMLPCEVCFKEFDRPSLLKRHLRTHTGERPHVCDVCSKGFSTSSSLNTHRRIHSGERPHQCPMCGKRFTASSNLYYHRMTHSAEKPHKCTICGKSFPTPGNLKSHLYAHGESSPHKCSTCGKAFTKQTNLRNHMHLHH